MIFCEMTSLVSILAPPAFDSSELNGAPEYRRANNRGRISALSIFINPFVFLIDQSKLDVIHSLI